MRAREITASSTSLTVPWWRRPKRFTPARSRPVTQSTRLGTPGVPLQVVSTLRPAASSLVSSETVLTDWLWTELSEVAASSSRPGCSIRSSPCSNEVGSQVGDGQRQPQRTAADALRQVDASEAPRRATPRPAVTTPPDPPGRRPAAAPPSPVESHRLSIIWTSRMPSARAWWKRLKVTVTGSSSRPVTPRITSMSHSGRPGAKPAENRSDTWSRSSSTPPAPRSFDPGAGGA